MPALRQAWAEAGKAGVGRVEGSRRGSEVVTHKRPGSADYDLSLATSTYEYDLERQDK